MGRYLAPQMRSHARSTNISGKAEYHPGGENQYDEEQNVCSIAALLSLCQWSSPVQFQDVDVMREVIGYCSEP